MRLNAGQRLTAKPKRPELLPCRPQHPRLLAHKLPRAQGNNRVNEDARWLAAAASLAARARPLSRPNPAVGAIIVRDGCVQGRGWTGAGGRPHAEALALSAAGSAAMGATLYVTLEPCAHPSQRGLACADLISASGLARVVIGCEDPDPRTRGKGIARLRDADIAVELMTSPEAEASLAGYLLQRRQGRPFVTLKLALSQDGRLARPPGESQWLTGEAARAHVHAWRAKMDAIVVGAGTLKADNPRLDVRLAGLELRSPERWAMTNGQAPTGWRTLADPQAIHGMADIQYLMVEGGADTARAFLAAGLIDRLMLYRAPIEIGGDLPALPELTAERLEHSGDWALTERRQLGSDTLEVYERQPCSLE
jgi:diaminohydroxyphosphoribosylaminopyrimidine deaminase/5-amino-6-(5-phosphoribosylamino)uracil reductase